MASREDKRHLGPSHPVATYSITQQTFATSATTATTTDLSNVNGVAEMIEIIINETTNNITFTVAIASADGGTLFSKATIADNGTTVIKLTDAATDVGKFLCNGTLTATVTPSGAPGSAATLDFNLYVR